MKPWGCFLCRMIFLYNNTLPLIISFPHRGNANTVMEKHRYWCVCVCVLCCSNTLQVNVFVMRIFHLSRFYAALIHSAAYRVCGLIRPANAETPLNTPDAHFPFSSFYSMCSWHKKKTPNFFHSSVFSNLRIRQWNASRPTVQTQNDHL